MAKYTCGKRQEKHVDGKSVPDDHGENDELGIRDFGVEHDANIHPKYLDGWGNADHGWSDFHQQDGIHDAIQDLKLAICENILYSRRCGKLSVIKKNNIRKRVEDGDYCFIFLAPLCQENGKSMIFPKKFLQTFVKHPDN